VKKILCIGEALIDMICTDKGSSLAAGQHFLKKPGGAPTNVAAAIAVLGGPVELIAKVGNDPFGDQLIETMKGFGVSTQWMLKDEEHFTTMAFVSLMENGERDFVFNRGADGYLGKDDLKEINLNDYSVIHFGSATAFLPGPLQEAYTSLFEKASTENIYTSFDPNYRYLLFQNNTASFIEQSWNFLDKVNFFKVSDEEAQLLTGCTAIDDAVKILAQKSKAVFAITLGEKGALIRVNDQTEIVPAVAVNVVDTTGAGDAFTGAVLFQLHKKTVTEIKDISATDWMDIVFKANKIAAKTCEYMGAMEAFKQPAILSSLV
jgi:fructokinase